MKKIILAGGCFWGVEEFLSRINGVVSTEVGYANGRTENPTYEDICTKNTYFAEVCLVNYDENIISCLLYTSPSPRDMRRSRMPSSA